MIQNKLRSMILLTAVLFSLTSQAATFEVNSENDGADFDTLDGICDAFEFEKGEQCTLRAAVMSANAMPDLDIIVIPAGFEIELDIPGAGGAEVGDLDITADVEIIGFMDEPPLMMEELPSINANTLDRHFDIETDVSVTIWGLRLFNGTAIAPGNGGAIRIQGAGANLQVQHSVFAFNSANGGGAISIAGATNTQITDSDFFRNDAGSQFGSAIRNASPVANVTILRSSFRDNRGSLGRQIQASGGNLSIENSTIDGTEELPPIAGLRACYGVGASNPERLVIRNTTIVAHNAFGSECGAVDLRNFAAGGEARIANSILADGASACSAINMDPDADIVIAYSLIESEENCSTYYSNVAIDQPELGPLLTDSGRVTSSRRPLSALSNVVDAGISSLISPPHPELACATEDQLGASRPIDGDGDGFIVCDLGAVEVAEPITFVVDQFAIDLVDVSPGDGACAAAVLPPVAACTLRAAVLEANALDDLQIIRFEESDQPVVLNLPDAPDGFGGDLELTESVNIVGRTLNGLPTTAILQEEDNRIFTTVFGPQDEAVLRNLIISGGNAQLSGGALSINEGLVVLINSRLEGNSSAQRGGAIHLENGALLMLSSDLAGNVAGESGAAISLAGGGINMARSSVRDHLLPNIAGQGVPAIEGDAGTVVWVFNSTIANNTTALGLTDPDSFIMQNSTVANNLEAGIRASFTGSNVVFNSNIIANANSGGSDCAFVDFAGAAITEYEYNLSSDGSCTQGFLTSFAADPLLDELSRPAGSVTWRLRPAHGAAAVMPSPALDVVPDMFCLEDDQHGVTRPNDLMDVINVDGACDIGAVEVVFSDVLFRDSFEIE